MFTIVDNYRKWLLLKRSVVIFLCTAYYPYIHIDFIYPVAPELNVQHTLKKIQFKWPPLLCILWVPMLGDVWFCSIILHSWFFAPKCSIYQSHTMYNHHLIKIFCNSQLTTVFHTQFVCIFIIYLHTKSQNP